MAENEIFYPHILQKSYEVWGKAAAFSFRKRVKNTCNFTAALRVKKNNKIDKLLLYIFKKLGILLIMEFIAFGGCLLTERIER